MSTSAQVSTRSGTRALQTIRKLAAVGIALSAEKDERRLMELILQSSRELTGADAGTLYSRTTDDELKFEIMINESLGVHVGAARDELVELPNVLLYESDGTPNDHNVAARAAIAGSVVNIPDAYGSVEFDFSGTRAFDAQTGYRSKSFLTVPMRNHEDEVIGVLQLINAMNDGRVSEFSAEDEEVVASLASQAAIALTNRRLIEGHKALFESFIELIAAAIDDKSPYTGGHCRRVPELTLMLADAAADTTDGPLADFQMSEEDRYELRIAGWLHDCGKITTPEYVVDKATKLETIFDRIELVDTRYGVLKRDAEIRALRRLGDLPAAATATQRQEIEDALIVELRELDEEREFLRHCNIGAEYMASSDQARVQQIAQRRWTDPEGQERNLLSENESYNLTIHSGTLTTEEREVINHHIVATIKMLESLPYPKDLQRVPEFAGGHHERMDGTGYPRGLRREEMSVQARVMGIADIFEALTARDRPYKPAMRLSEALRILGKMKLDNHIDPDLFDVFIAKRVYLNYAERFLEPEQLDAVDHDDIPGYGESASTSAAPPSQSTSSSQPPSRPSKKKTSPKSS